MADAKKSLPVWILVVLGLLALLEVMVSVTMCLSPESVLDNVDLRAKGVVYVVYMWAGRQFALGFIFGFATLRKSIPMLTIAYVFFFVMFAADFLVGILQKESSLVTAAVVMCAVSSVMIFLVNKKR